MPKKVAVDFGTGNTVLAWFNEAVGRAETIEIPGITTAMPYRLRADVAERIVHVVPSLIHYSETETLIGDQVLSRGLAEHRDTFRWMKRGIARRVSKRKKTVQGHKSPAQAGEEFLKTLLTYASDQVSLADDEFTFTAPSEAFEDFQDWLRGVCESLGIQRLRMLDEPTACVLGYQGSARKDDRFLIFDFGCGTLDVSAVRIDLASHEDKKAVQLGQAGKDIGGLDLDAWLAEDFCQRHGLDDRERRELEAIILRQAEATKIALSDPAQEEADMQVIDRLRGRPRLSQTNYRRSCPDCQRGQPGTHADPGESCLGCLMLGNHFLPDVRETLDRALENAAVKAGLRRDDVVKVLVTGGTSLVPAVRRLLLDYFGARAVLQDPFDAVARGACRGIVFPILQHDYCLGCYNPDKPDDYKPLFKIGTEYPTPDTVKKWIGGTVDGQTRCGLFIYEVSRMKRRSGSIKIGLHGELGEHDPSEDGYAKIPLNRENPTFIVADPPIVRDRDRRRFHCTFTVDGHRRLLVTVLDNLTTKTLLKDHPVVRL